MGPPPPPWHLDGRTVGAWRRGGPSGLRWLPLLLLVGCSSGRAAGDALPSAGELGLELVDEAGAPIRALGDGEVIERGALIRFVVDVERGDYLHLLQRNERGISVLYPSTGLVWMCPAAVEHLVPQPPYLRDEERQLGFNGEDDGAAEYLLIAAPVPRPVPADSWLPDLATFLTGPPYVQGPATADAVVLDRVTLHWGEHRTDPEVPQVGGDDDRDGPQVGGEDDRGRPQVDGEHDPAPE